MTARFRETAQRHIADEQVPVKDHEILIHINRYLEFEKYYTQRLM